MNYDEIINHLSNKTRTDYNLERVKLALSVLNLRIDANKVILVAGTNGKGSTCAMLQTLLKSAGHKIGFYSSPHLMNTTERIKFDGIDISQNDFCRIFEIIAVKTDAFQLSHFEYLTLMAAYYFFEYHDLEIDYAIFEVGLGGSFDATNIIPHAISIITRLGMDHCDVLGNDIIAIAQNKFGIISENNTVFHVKFDDIIQATLDEHARHLNAKLIRSVDCSIVISHIGKYPSFRIKTPYGTFDMSMQGDRAIENASTAITVFNHLFPNNFDKIKHLNDVLWPCRMEKLIYKGRDIFLSGDHNPQGIQSLIDLIKYYNFQKVHFIVGICIDKNHEEMFEKLISVKVALLYLTETPYKTTPLEQYPPKYQKIARFASKDPLLSLDEAILHADLNDLIIVTGSLYLVGFIKDVIRKTTSFL